MQSLLENFFLKRVSPLNYEGKSRANAWPRLFGGLFLAQAIMAVYEALDEAEIFDKTIHSLHGYFMQAGEIDRPLNYEVRFLRQGKSFILFQVVASQKKKIGLETLFMAMISMHSHEKGFDYLEKQNFLSKPNELICLQSDNFKQFEQKKGIFLKKLGLSQNENSFKKVLKLSDEYWRLQYPFLFMPQDLENYYKRHKKEISSRNWFFLDGKEEQKQQLSKRQIAALLAYMSDMTILDQALMEHHESIFTQNMQTGSLDHALWFHNLFGTPRYKEIFLKPLCYQLKTVATGGNRAFIQGQIYQFDGQLCVSCAQEGLMRQKIAR